MREGSRCKELTHTAAAEDGFFAPGETQSPIAQGRVLPGGTAAAGCELRYLHYEAAVADPPEHTYLCGGIRRVRLIGLVPYLVLNGRLPRWERADLTVSEGAAK